MYLSVSEAVALVTNMLGEEFVTSKKIQSIKLVRQLTNQGLKESKDAVEREIVRLQSINSYTYQAPTSTRDNRLKAITSMRLALNDLESHVRAQRDDFVSEPVEGSVIMFTHVFPSGGRTYTYVATRNGGAWYITGQSGTYTWENMQQKFRALRNSETFTYLG